MRIDLSKVKSNVKKMNDIRLTMNDDVEQDIAEEGEEKTLEETEREALRETKDVDEQKHEEEIISSEETSENDVNEPVKTTTDNISDIDEESAHNEQDMAALSKPESYEEAEETVVLDSKDEEQETAPIVDNISDILDDEEASDEELSNRTSLDTEHVAGTIEKSIEQDLDEILEEIEDDLNGENDLSNRSSKGSTEHVSSNNEDEQDVHVENDSQNIDTSGEAHVEPLSEKEKDDGVPKEDIGSSEHDVSTLDERVDIANEKQLDDEEKELNEKKKQDDNDNKSVPASFIPIKIPDSQTKKNREEHESTDGISTPIVEKRQTKTDKGMPIVIMDDDYIRSSIANVPTEEKTTSVFERGWFRIIVIGLVVLVLLTMMGVFAMDAMRSHQSAQNVSSLSWNVGMMDDEDKELMMKQAESYNHKLVGEYDTKDTNVFGLSYDDILNVYDAGIMATITIPTKNIEQPIYHGTSDDVLSKGVGHFANTSFPVGGSSTRCVLCGYSGLMSGGALDGISSLENGDVVKIDVLGEELEYEVYEKETKNKEEIANGFDVLDGQDVLTIATYNQNLPSAVTLVNCRRMNQ